MVRNHSHINAKSIDEYAYSSGLKNINSCLKVMFTFIFIITTISSDNWITPIFSILSCGIITIKFGKISFLNYISLFSIPVVFMIMSCAAIALSVDLNNGLTIAFHHNDIVHAFIIAAKALGAVSIMYMLSLSTPMEEIITVLGKLRIPDLICELMRLIYRYIFILADSHIKMKNSAISRLGYTGYRRSLKTFGLICSNMLATSFHRASDYYNAVESRSCNENIKFLSNDYPLKKSHIIKFCVWIITAVGIEVFCRSAI